MSSPSSTRWVHRYGSTPVTTACATTSRPIPASRGHSAREGARGWCRLPPPPSTCFVWPAAGPLPPCWSLPGTRCDRGRAIGIERHNQLLLLHVEIWLPVGRQSDQPGGFHLQIVDDPVFR